MRWLIDLPAHQEHIVESSCGTAFSVLLRADTTNVRRVYEQTDQCRTDLALFSSDSDSESRLTENYYC
jgi:alpha-tubulin suppressor-like RCC1 family protein